MTNVIDITFMQLSQTVRGVRYTKGLNWKVVYVANITPKLDTRILYPTILKGLDCPISTTKLEFPKTKEELDLVAQQSHYNM